MAEAKQAKHGADLLLKCLRNKWSNSKCVTKILI